MNPLDRVSYAQNKEDIILATLLDNKRKGFYVDVGANDPVLDSVTKWFYDRGWSGVNVEPIPANIKEFARIRKRDKNLNVAIGAEEATLVLREYTSASGHSTLSEEVKNQHAGTKYKDHKVKVFPLKSILKDTVPTNTTIDFLKVDVEGFEYEVISSNDWNVFRPVIVCIEAVHGGLDWRPLLVHHNYELIFNDGINEYYRDTENTPDFTRIDFLEKLIINVQNSISSTAYHHLLKRERRLIAGKEKEIAMLREASMEGKPLRTRLKMAIKGLTTDWLDFKRSR